MIFGWGSYGGWLGKADIKKQLKQYFPLEYIFGVNQTHQLLPLFYFTFRNHFMKLRPRRKRMNCSKLLLLTCHRQSSLYDFVLVPLVPTPVSQR